MLRRLLQEADMRYQILQENNKLLQQNKQLLEEKLLIYQKNDETKQPKKNTVEPKQIVNRKKSRSGTEKQCETVIQADSEKTPTIIISENNDWNNLKQVQFEKTREIININNDIPEEEFQMVKPNKHRRKLGKKKLYGEGFNRNGHNDFAAEKKVWNSNRIKRSISEHDIKRFIRAQESVENANVTVKELPTKENQTKCFMFGLDWKYKDEIYKPTSWPKNIGYKRFDFRRYRQYQANETANGESVFV